MLNEKDQIDPIEKLAKIIEEEPMELMTLSSGAVIKPKRLPELMLNRLWAQFPSPLPPEVEIKKGGKTWTEPNYDDPAYKRAVSRRAVDIGESTLKLMLLKAIEIVTLPPGVKPFEEDQEWKEDYEALGAEVPVSLTAQRLEWLRYRILVNNTDFERVQDACLKLAGVKQEDVDAALDRFQS